MQYKFITERPSYDCYAGGKVLYSFPGLTAFPVRLASEIFLQCKALLGGDRPCTLYDPCCGSAYSATVLGFLHPESINCIIASDVSEDVLETARRNLSLLSPAGMDRRMEELRRYIRDYGKPSHVEALECAVELKKRITGRHDPIKTIKTISFLADATKPSDLKQHIAEADVDLVFADIPYGRKAFWHDGGAAENPAEAMLSALSGLLRKGSLVAIASSKREKIAISGYECVRQFKAGLRRIVILRK